VGPEDRAGVTTTGVIERALNQADCVVVLWSAHAVESDWVRARVGRRGDGGILVPALIEDVQPPLQFRLIETIDLTSWVADPTADAFDRLREAVAHRAPPLEPMARWREALVGEPAMDRRRSDPRSSWVSGARFSTPGRQSSSAVTAAAQPLLECPALVGAVRRSRPTRARSWSCAAERPGAS
jgi:hypothetical protein